MRRFALIVGVVAITFVLAVIILIGGPIRWPSQDSTRSVVLPTHTGLGVGSTDSFLGEPVHDGDCFYYTDTDGVRMLPVWPPGYSGKLGARFLGVYRPEDPADNAFNVTSEILEFRGEWVRVPYRELRAQLQTAVPEACQRYRLFLVAEAIQRS